MKHLTEAILKDLRLPIGVFNARQRDQEKTTQLRAFLEEQHLRMPVYCFYAASSSEFAVGVHNGVLLALCPPVKRGANHYMLLSQTPDGTTKVKNWYQGEEQDLRSPKGITPEGTLTPVEHPATLHGYQSANEALASYLTPFISLSRFDKNQLMYYKENAAWLL